MGVSCLCWLVVKARRNSCPYWTCWIGRSGWIRSSESAFCHSTQLPAESIIGTLSFLWANTKLLGLGRTVQCYPIYWTSRRCESYETGKPHDQSLCSHVRNALWRSRWVFISLATGPVPVAAFTRLSGYFCWKPWTCDGCHLFPRGFSKSLQFLSYTIRSRSLRSSKICLGLHITWFIIESDTFSWHETLNFNKSTKTG